MVAVVPELAAEMEQELRASGDAGLAEQVAGLRMMRSCGCGDDFCASFYTCPYPEESWKGNHRAAALSHRLILDVVDGEIGFVEVLFRGRSTAQDPYRLRGRRGVEARSAAGGLAAWRTKPNLRP